MPAPTSRPWATIAVSSLTLFIGLTLGGEYCAPSTSEVQTSATPTLICATCPVCDPIDGVAAKQPSKPRTKPLPKADPQPLPQTRKRLLAWVRGRANELQHCRASGTASETLGVTVRLGDGGAVSRVRLHHTSRALDQADARCLRRTILTWVFPADWVAKGEDLMFSLRF